MTVSLELSRDFRIIMTSPGMRKFSKNRH